MATKSRCCVVIVDDDFDIRDTVSRILRLEGYEVAAAANGAEALARLREQRPSLILLDLMMPVMDGWQFHAQLAKDPQLAAIPVVVLSGAGAAGDGDHTVRAADYLPKPLDLDDLLAVVERYCSKSAA